jgi:ABC-type proline/glycine betaine transport system permease subunit
MWEDIDEDEFNTGRLIGMLERIFIFLLVIFNQYAAIGFIIAAKGVTRFKELENRNFAEYILIGTLLSALSAVLVGLLVRFLIQYS